MCEASRMQRKAGGVGRFGVPFVFLFASHNSLFSLGGAGVGFERAVCVSTVTANPSVSEAASSKPICPISLLSRPSNTSTMPQLEHLLTTNRL